MLLNVVAFQAGWLACVLGAAHGWAWAGTAAALGIIGWHAARAARPSRELLLVAVAVIAGACWDSTLGALGWLSFASPAPLAPFAPYWILAMWGLFATTLNVSLRWLRGRWAIAALLGALAGPLSYVAGTRLGAVELLQPALALAALAAGWALMLPLLIALGERTDGIRAAA